MSLSILVTRAQAQHFELLVMYKITFKLDETLTQWLIKIEQHERYNNKPYRNKDGKEWKRLTRITNDELDKLRPKSSRCTNHDVVPLTRQHVIFHVVSENLDHVPL